MSNKTVILATALAALCSGMVWAGSGTRDACNDCVMRIAMSSLYTDLGKMTKVDPYTDGLDNTDIRGCSGDGK
jgi:hypothetical protein